ncbi:lipocalin family protein [Alcanivorax sp. 1008]|uniref:lipocalin family protein n=1 Tax=Alcanivorax sp. 1008 TaxID=2816853 RepID=UPI001D7631FE|nr:lipocalin family protein [Alcanivorax sp. 1008]MCC1497215.1 lipocalin family protein [Alcanivorax sp. 1008]
MGRVGIALLALLLTACTGAPEGISPVTGFELPRYLGTWHEIARLDHSFERDMSEVTALYELNEDGSVKVTNRGYLDTREEWKEAVGKAKFVGAEDVGHLKVSFFGPFYGGYVIYELDHEGYEYAFVTSYNRNYLWMLARNPMVSAELKDRFVRQANELGFDTEELIWVKQTIH